MQHRYWIFDMDGTLTDSMGIWGEVPCELLRGFGIEPRPGLRETLLPMSMEETGRYLVAEYGLPLDAEGYTRAVMEAIGRLYETVELKAGVPAVLDRLRAEGARLCVCSATWQFMCERVLGRLGVLDRFNFVLSARDGYTKHEPDIFYEAMRRLGAENPAECMVCEDALYAARTACGAGFGVIGIADAASRADEAALRRVSSQFLTSWEALDWTAL